VAEISEILRLAVGRLKAAGVESAGLDTRLLLQAIGGVSHADILSGRALPLSAEAQARFAAAIARRAAHEPVHRILGRRAFYGREFALSGEGSNAKGREFSLRQRQRKQDKAKQKGRGGASRRQNVPPKAKQQKQGEGSNVRGREFSLRQRQRKQDKAKQKGRGGASRRQNMPPKAEQKERSKAKMLR